MAEVFGFRRETAERLLAIAGGSKRLPKKSPAPRPAVRNTNACFVLIPGDGIPGATVNGAKPSKTACQRFDPIGTDGELVQAVFDGEPQMIDVYHYGAPVTGRDENEFHYMQVKRDFAGSLWVLYVKYCDGDGSGNSGGAVVGSSVVGTAVL